MEPSRQEPNTTARQAHFTLWDTVCIIVGIIIGAGIFKTPGSVFALSSGPGAALAVWVAGGLFAVLGAFCFAELASTYPRSGGDYVYVTQAFGAWAGFLFAWGNLLIVRTAAGMVALAYIFAEYAARLLEIDESVDGFAALYTLLALAPVVGLTIINILGVQLGKRTQNTLVVVKVLGLAGVLVAGFVWGVGKDTGVAKVTEGTILQCDAKTVVLQTQPNERTTFALGTNTEITLNNAGEIDNRPLPSDLVHNWAKVVVMADGKVSRVKAIKQGPWLALASALVMVLWTFGGWHEGAYVASEVRNLHRNLPRALLLATAAVIVLYLLVNVACIWGLGFEAAADSEAVAAGVLARVPGGISEPAICLLVMLSSLGAINGSICTNSRIFAEFGNDHALFASLGRWNKRLGTPVAALLVQLGVCVATIAVIAFAIKSYQAFDKLISGTAPVFWLFFLAAGVALFVLRAKDRDIERPFRTPLYPLTPLLYCGGCAMMVIASLLAKPIDGLAWMGILLLGLPLYWMTRQAPKRS